MIQTSKTAENARETVSLEITDEPRWLLDSLVGSDEAGEAEEAALDEMSRDLAAPLTSDALRLLLDPAQVAAATASVLPHLIADYWSRTALENALNLAAMPADHPAYALLAMAEEAARWNTAAQEATERSRAELLEKGIGYIYGRPDGSVYRHLPEGTEERIEVPGA